MWGLINVYLEIPPPRSVVIQNFKDFNFFKGMSSPNISVIIRLLCSLKGSSTISYVIKVKKLGLCEDRVLIVETYRLYDRIVYFTFDETYRTLCEEVGARSE